MDETPPDQTSLPPAQPGTQFEPTPPVNPADIPPPQVQQKPKKSRLGMWLGLVILLIAAAAAAWLLTRHHNATKTAVSTKKDIPYLTYGTDESADLTQAFPTETAETDTTTQVNTQLFEGLVRYQQTTKVVPLLATDWSNPDTSTWVFNLRQGVKFHTGRTMTADDVKYSLDYAVAHQNDNNGSTLLSLASTIKQVDVVNPYKIKITTDGPDPILLNRLAYMYIMDSKAKIGDYDAGTGSYIVKPGSKPTTDTLDLVANDKYWGGHIYTRAVHIVVYDNNDKLATDTNDGKFDLAGDFTNQQLTKIKHYQPITVQDLGITFIGLNTLKAGSPLQSLNARKAASYALDIPAILKAGSLNGTQSSQLIPETIPGHDPSIANTPYNPTKAKQLLAGVPNLSTPLTLSFPAGDEAQVAEIAKELNAVGFNIKTQSVADLDTLVNQGLGGQIDMYYLADSTSTLDGLALINDLIISAAPNYSSPSINKLADEAAVTLDPAKRIKLLQQISQQVAKDIPDIPLYTQNRTTTLTKPYHVQVDIPSIEAGVYFAQIYQ